MGWTPEVEVRCRIQVGVSDTSGSECLEKGHVRQKISKKLKGKVLRACYTSMRVWSGDSGVDRTTTEASSL